MGIGRPGTSYGRLGPVGAGQRGLRVPRAGTFAPRRKPLTTRVLSRESPLRHMDWALTLAVTALGGMGVVVVWAATAPARGEMVKQAIYLVIGLAVMFAVSLVSYRQIRIYAPIVYALSLLSLLAVLTPLGTRVNGSKGWISLPGGFQIEPPEFAKIALILMIAVIFAELRDRDRAGRPAYGAAPPRPRHALAALACGLPMIALVAVEPALGMALVLVAVLAGMILLAGIRLRWVAVGCAVAALAGVAVFSMHLLKSYQLQRLTSFLHPGAHTKGSGYQALEAKMTVGSGGMFGQGLLHGQSVAGSYVPSQPTDFIFTVAGQELGFVGAIVIVFLLGVVVVRALRIASRADDLFGMLAASGVAIWFIVQSFVNIGMTIGITPVTGIPLPFVSYGGSALITDMIAVGVLQSVHRKRKVFD
jgi:rod shape determining protein RodA